MKHSNLLFLLILTLLLGGSYSLAGARVNTPDSNRSDAPAGDPQLRPGGDSGFLTGPNDGEPLDIALEYLEKNKSALGLTSDDVADVVVTDQYTSQHNGVTHIYLRQRYQGIEVFSADLNINIAADGSVINMSHRFISDLAKAVNTSRASLSATQAVESAAQELRLEISESLRVVEQTRGPANETLLSDGGISLNDIPAKLMYQPYKDQVYLAWDLLIYEKDAQHWWDMRVDALTGELLDQKDLVISENWGHSEQHEHNQPHASHLPNTPQASVRWGGTLLATCTATGGSDEYCVYAMPAETPNHGSRSMQTNPADSTASPYGWHDTDGAAGAESNHTVGNNVDAYEDTNNSNSPTGGDAARADGGTDRVFNFDVDLSQEPSTYQDAAISNLFYWNNLIHDVFYQYGFNEASGNFQENNYDNGGVGSDAVRAEAQDGGGTNNANFATPPDGSNPRMQMYLWNLTSPSRDGDFDNGIIMHEYGHGISIRLTGGPSNSSCLWNNEQGGEGWSDWFGLMLTMKAGDMGADKRGIGTYVLGQPTDGDGIRPAPYSTDIAINNYTYGRIDSQAIPHGVGFVWATMLWEMNWALIDQHGFDPDIYNGGGGNNIAMQLVVDGLKLQPCSPGFVDARDAILQADQINNNGANQCLIWDAFAKRGLGYSAQQGSSESTTDGSEAFDIPPACETLAVIPETQNICVGDTASYTVLVGQAFTPPVTMSASGQPVGSSATFNPNPVTTTPNSTTLTIDNTAGVATGHYTIMITGTDTISTSHVMADLNLFDGNPDSVILSQPSDGATGVSRSPTFEWNAASGAQSYDIEVASDSGFSNIVYSASSQSTSHTATSSLSALTTYYWRVRAVNPCGNGSHSGVFAFTSEDTPPILLVDDDDNSPDVRASYTDALDALGQSYDIWDTENSDDEPDASYLAAYDMVIWFTGDEFGGAAGPASAGETALSSYLDSGHCLFISSQDYYYDRGLTTFMKDYLGVASASSDVGQTTVSGDGMVFSGLGPYSLDYPVNNYSDVISPDNSAEVAFSGDKGEAAVNKDNGVYRATFFGYPFEAIPSNSERQTVMQTILDWCGTGVTTGTLKGVVTDADTNAGLSGATITADDGNMQRTTRTDANGHYTISLAVETYDLIASATNYLSDTLSAVVITTDTVSVRDFVLQGSSLSYSPAQIEHSMEIGDVVSTTVTVQNSGPLPIEFNVRLGNYDAPGVQLQPTSISIPASDGHFPRGSGAPSIGRPPANHQSEVASQEGHDLGRLNLNGGVEAYGVDLFVPDLLSFTTDDPANTTSVATVDGSFYAGDFLGGDFSTLYALDNGESMLYAIDTATGDMTAIGPSRSINGQTWSGMAGDPTTGTMYAVSTNCSNNTIYTIDRATGTPTVVGSARGVCIIDIAINAAGEMYGLDITDDELLSINKATGAVTVIGSIGFDANYAQDMDFDEESNTLYLAALNFATLKPELRIADTTTGNTALVGPIDAGEVDSFAIATGGSNSPWASAEPNSGTVPANSSATFEVVFDTRAQSQLGEHTAELKFSGTFVNDLPTMPLTMQLACPTCGLLNGEITSSSTGAPVNAQLHVTSTNGFDVMLNGESYEIAVLPGTYNFTASANGYFDQSATVVATEATTVTTDFVLTPMIAVLEYTPREIEESMQVGDVVSNSVTVTNSGYVDLEFNVQIGNYDGPSVQLQSTSSSISIPASDGDFPRGSEAPSIGRPPPDHQSEVASQDEYDLELLNQLNNGVQAYGVDLFTPESLLSFMTDDPANTTSIAAVNDKLFAGDFLDGDFSTLYVLDNEQTMLYAIDTATGHMTAIGPSLPSGNHSWTGMAGDPTSGIMYASSSDCSDNTIYTIDIATGTPTLVGSTTGVCIIDIAINAAGEMYGLDIIRDELLSIDKATGAVTVIGSIGFDANFAQDMDFDEEANILYLATFNNAAFDAELRIADTTTGNTTLVGAINAGQVDSFGIATGGTSGSRWASAEPNSGTVPPNSSATFEVVFDARTVTEHGEHTANLIFSGNFVNDVPTMPLTMQLGCPTCGFLNGQITDLETGDAVNAQLHVTSTNGFDAMLNGESYQIAVLPGTYNFTVTANGYFDQSATVVASEAMTVTTDFVLTPMIAKLEYTPAGIEETMAVGDVVSNSITVTNSGYVDLEFNVRFGNYDDPSIQLQPSSIAIPASDGDFPRGGAAPSIGRPPADHQGEVGSQEGLNLDGGVQAYGIDPFVRQLLSFTTDDPANTTSIATIGGSFFAGDFLGRDFSTLYALDYDDATLVAIDTATGDMTTIGPSRPMSGNLWSGMAGDPTSGTMYAVSTDCSDNTIYTIDTATGRPTVVGSTTGVCIVDIAINAAGQMYGLDVVGDELLSIDKATGAVTVIGSIGFDANFAQDMDFHEQADILYLAGFNNAASEAQLRIADTTTGNTALVGAIDSNQVDSFGIASGYQWVSAQPNSGTVPPNSSATFEVVFDARELVEPGEYTAELNFSGHFLNDVPAMPLTMTVLPPASVVISDVRTTNLRDVSFTASWLTDAASTGYIRYGTDPNNLSQSAQDVRGAATSDETHYVLVQNLSPNTTYYFDVLSGSTTDDNGGAHYTVTTGPTLGVPSTDTVYGDVFKADGTTPANGTIVYITLNDNDGNPSSGQSAPLSALVENGTWNTNLGNVRIADLSAYFSYSASGDQLQLEAYGAANSTACQSVDTAQDKPAAAMVLDNATCGTRMTITVQEGWNSVALPLNPGTEYSAESVCAQIGQDSMVEIDRWYTSGWQGHICGQPFNNFDIEMTSSYFIKSDAVSNWSIQGTPMTTATLDLEVGWNSINVPHTDGYTAESLCDEVISQGISLVEINRWHAGGWQAHICGLPFNNFDIERGVGYFLKSTSAGTVTPPAITARAPQPSQQAPFEVGQTMPVSNLVVSNRSDTSVTLSWTTQEATTGYVRFGEQVAYDIRGANSSSTTHYVVLDSLSPESSLDIEIISGAEVMEERTITTPPSLESIPQSDTIYGKVYLSDGVTPAAGALVYLQLQHANDEGAQAMPLSAVVDSDGYWHTNLGNARTNDLSTSFNYTQGDQLSINVQGTDGGFYTTTLQIADNAQTRDITLTAATPTAVEIATYDAAHASTPWQASVLLVTFLLAAAGWWSRKK